MAKNDNVDFTVIVLDGALSSAVAVTLDMLGAADQFTQALGIGRGLRWVVRSPGKKADLGTGMHMSTLPLTSRTRLGRSTVVLPGLHLLPLAAFRAGEDPRLYLSRRCQASDIQELLLPLLRRHHSRGGAIAASCSSTLLLGMAGLLEGRRATTHWALGDWLKQISPACQVDAARMVVEDANITTAGAAMGQVDLMLHLLGRRVGSKVVDLVLKNLLLDRRSSQALYAVWQRLAVQSPLTTRIEDLVVASLPEVPSLQELSSQLCVSSRTLARRIAKETGGTPHQFIQAIRMRKAQLLLETTTLPVSEVAARVGYADPSGLHRLTRHLAKRAPGRLRPRD